MSQHTEWEKWRDQARRYIRALPQKPEKLPCYPQHYELHLKMTGSPTLDGIPLEVYKP